MEAQLRSNVESHYWQPSVAVLIPVYNEAARMHLVETLTQKLCAAFAGRDEHVVIVFVNDASTDETTALLTDMLARQQHNQIKIRLCQLVLATNTRKAGVYLVACQEIAADYYLFIDADDSFAIVDAIQMLQLVQQNQSDLVVGHKPVANETTAWARAAIRCVNRLLSKPLLPAGITDSQTGLKAFRRIVVDTAFARVKSWHGFTADLVVLHAAKQLGFNAQRYFVQCINRERSHVNLLHDSTHHLKVIASLYLTRLLNIQPSHIDRCRSPRRLPLWLQSDRKGATPL